MEKSYSKLTDKLSTVIAILNRIKIYENNSKNIDYKAFYLYVESLVKFLITLLKIQFMKIGIRLRRLVII